MLVPAPATALCQCERRWDSSEHATGKLRGFDLRRDPRQEPTALGRDVLRRKATL